MTSLTSAKVNFNQSLSQPPFLGAHSLLAQVAHGTKGWLRLQVRADATREGEGKRHRRGHTTASKSLQRGLQSITSSLVVV